MNSYEYPDDNQNDRLQQQQNGLMWWEQPDVLKTVDKLWQAILAYNPAIAEAFKASKVIAVNKPWLKRFGNVYIVIQMFGSQLEYISNTLEYGNAAREHLLKLLAKPNVQIVFEWKSYQEKEENIAAVAGKLWTLDKLKAHWHDSEIKDR